MMRMIPGLVAGCWLIAVAHAGEARAGAPADELARRVAPILTRCAECHSGDEPAGGLDLTTREAALDGGESGLDLIPSKAADSPLYRKVAAGKMPPRSPLPAEQVALVRDWIDAGAPWEGTIRPRVQADARWAFRPLGRPEPPKVEGDGRVCNPIDAFLLARLESEGLSYAPTADRITLIRRATFDLLGLPPTPEEIDAFVNDPSEDAYEALIDRLLASPHYGERWGRHWLDVARFAESQGFEYDRIRDHSWPYRDYVIASLNADKPYDRFVREQIAGDVQEPATAEGIAATGFLVAGPYDEAGNLQQSAVMRARAREEELEDMVSAVGQTFLGVTVNCARCHDHKFDPIPQRDYYRIKAALEGVRHGNRPLATPDEIRTREAERSALVAAIGRLEAESDAIEREARAVLAEKLPPRDGPTPLARWTFEIDERDEAGGATGTLVGGASVRGGRLRLDGKGSFLKSAPLPRAVREKTLEAWVAPANLTQRGGGVVSVERADRSAFDAIVFGERVAGKWMAGSEFFRRSVDLAAPDETAKPGELVHLVIVYAADGRIALFRNGRPHGENYRPSGEGAALREYPADEAHVLIGLRHDGAGNGYFAGEVEEATLYDRALSGEEIAASFRAGPAVIRPEALAEALGDERRQRLAELRSERERQRSALEALGPSPSVYAANPTQPPPTFVLARGDVLKKGEHVAAGGLSAIAHPSPDFGLLRDASEDLRRRMLAEWIAHPANPLTARVIVNRVWHYHFGTGIVATPNDFGANGERPTNPALLDWLAGDFLAGGGRLKALHRRIMLSGAYRQSPRLDPKAAAIDAEDRLLWRFPPRRLEAEAIRDAMLCAGGRINFAMGGPSFRPFRVTVFNSSFYDLFDAEGPEFDRRTVYRININSAKDPLLDALDCPDPSVKAPRRAVTTTPLQALGLMNNVFVLRQARALAGRALKGAGGSIEEGVSLAYRLALGREPTPAERDRAAKVGREHGLEHVCWALLNSSEFLYVR